MSTGCSAVIGCSTAGSGTASSNSKACSSRERTTGAKVPFPEHDSHRLSSGEEAALYIRRLIFEGRLRPGERVPQEEVARAFEHQPYPGPGGAGRARTTGLDDDREEPGRVRRGARSAGRA